jgi:hypothetical protein
MAKIPSIKIDQTLADVDKALEDKKNSEAPRHYLGMSQVGEECWRKLFYSFRSASKRSWNASGVRNIEDGFVQEDIMAERLRMLDYIELHTVDPKNPKKQIGFSMLLDHFKGHCDGMIKGVKIAPQTWHVWENKAVNVNKFNKLQQYKEKNEKTALAQWDMIYHDQAQIYMHCSQTLRHYLTVQTPGGRDYTSCRTDYNRNAAETIIAKANAIIFDNWVIPARMSEKREFYQCKWCEYQGVCHDGDFPLVNCKTCRYSEPIKNGVRTCLFHDKDIEEMACDRHIYNPALVPGVISHEHQDDGCVYQMENGFQFANIIKSGLPDLKGNLDAIFPSQYLFDNIKNVNNFSKETVNVLNKIEGEIIETEPKKAWDKRLEDI